MQEAVSAKLSLFSHCQMNLFWHKFTLFLKSWDVQHDISLTLIIALIGHFVISANSMQFAFHINYGMEIK